MRGAREDLANRAVFDDATRVHDRDIIREVGYDGQVVRDVQRRDTVLTRERADRGEHVLLGRHVESSGRLVEDDHRWTTGERHGETDTLLLAARQLVRIALEILVICWQQDFRHHLLHARLTSLIRATEVVRFEHLHELRADA